MRKTRMILAIMMAVVMCMSLVWVSGAEVYEAAVEDIKAREIEKRLDALLDFSAKIDEMISKYMPKDLKRDVNDPYASARIIVKSAEELDYDGSLSAVNGYNDMHIVQYATPEEARKACEKYAALDYVKYAEPDRLMSIAAAPGDDSFLSWGYEEGHVDAFNYNEWLLEYVDGLSNLPEITVAVIDTGADSDHPFIMDRLVPGYDFVNNDSNPEDDHYHGTHVSGTIIDGTLPNVKVMPLKALDSGGFGDQSDIVLAMEYAYLNGCSVVNMSLRGRGYSQAYADAIAEALTYGTLFCVASGNDSGNVEDYCPANVEDAYTVAAVDSAHNMAYFSNTGSLVDISAPGVQINSSMAGGGYDQLDGTSMATPHVAAAAAMLFSYNATFTPNEVTNVLDNAALDVGLSGGGEGMLTVKDLLKYDFVLNAEGLNIHFTSEGNYPWDVTDEYAYTTNTGADNTTSTLVANITLGAYQTLIFDYSVDSEENYDFFNFYVNDELVLAESGNVAWQNFTYDAGAAGDYEFKWEYQKNSSGSEGDDIAMIKNVQLLESLSSILNGDDSQYSLLFETEANYPWIIDGDAAKSGNVGINNSESVLYAEVELGAGIDIVFDYMVDAGSGDVFTFSVNGTNLIESTGTNGWQEFEYTTTADDIYELEWVFTKDGSGSSGEDAAWIRNVVVYLTLDYIINVPGGNLDFTNNGTYPWLINDQCGMSGNRGAHNTSSTLSLNIYMQEGDILSFRYMVSSESRYDKFKLVLNGANIFEESGNIGWTTYTYTAESAGNYEFKWVYTKDGSVSTGQDAAFLDDVCLTRGNYLPGDANSDGEVNAMDALLVLRYALDVVPETALDIRNADYNGDGDVNAMDALAILRYSLA